ncbi:MAG TPA: RIO1 family regulatory kinase/ATPase [Thermoplasmata archaeon]|nr:RIO1 family regulatory kinase/ATPase [Thermoplasmata archaeon]
MPNAPYLDASVRWKVRNGGIAFREPRAAEVAEQLLDLGLVTEVLRPIGAGKEADVFLARDGPRYVAAKVYRLYRTANRSRGAVKADGMGHLASREFELLGYAWAHRTPVPEPIQREENAFTMEYLGTPDQPAPQLRSVHLEDPEPFARALLEAIESLAGGGIVHPDLSPFNVLVHEGRPWIIDLGKALRVDRLGWPPRARLEEARTHLVHALDALRRYFRRYGIDLDTAPVLTSIFREIDGMGVLGPDE